MKRFFLPMLMLFLGSAIQSLAQGNLLVTPTRSVFEGNKQKEKIYLVNTGKETTSYSVSFLQYRQNEDGGYTIVKEPDPGQLFAEPYLRIYPRTVTLAPGETQSVMIYSRRKADMPSGEYRSHLYFRSEKDYSPLGDERADTIKTVQVRLTPIYGVSIPVLIRKGNISASATLSDLKLDKPDDSMVTLNLTINRSGDMSVNGDLIVDYIPVKGKSSEIGKLKSVAVYTDNSKRFVSVKLNITPGMTLNSGKLEVRYISADTKKTEIYSEAHLNLK